MTRWFLTEYKAGGRFGVPGYTQQGGNYVHSHTGITVWADVLDLSGGASSCALAFHYTNELGFSNVTNASKAVAEMWASLQPDVDAHWGRGTYGSSKDPEAFGSREAVLTNNYYSQLVTNPDERVKDRNGNVTNQTNKEVFGDAARCAYCIPILAKAVDVYDVRVRATPEMPRPGVNVKGHSLLEGRDVLVVRALDSQGEVGALQAKLVETRRHRAAACETRLGAKDEATLGAQQGLVDALRDRGQYEEALPLQRAVLTARDDVLGKEHPNTLASAPHTGKLASLGWISFAVCVSVASSCGRFAFSVSRVAFRRPFFPKLCLLGFQQ